ncbi:MAG: replication-relaxation family protein [Baekduia sp.]
MTHSQQRRPVRLTGRDLQILEELVNRKAETLDALHQRFWTDKSRETARNRLTRLAAWGFIDKHALQHQHDRLLPEGKADNGWVTAYTLTPRGTAALRLRTLSGSALRGRSIKGDIDEAAIPHQLAVNRVADLLGTTLIAEHLIELSGDRRHRPDATYTATPDETGRSTVMLEIDLGHYSRKRILGKLATFLADSDAKGVLFACPTQERAAWVARTLRQARGDRIMDRVQVLSFHQIREGRLLRDDLRPTTATTNYPDINDLFPKAA